MISEFELLSRLILGALFGGAIGYERQVHGRPAGFRTHLLVCVASVLLMEVSEYYHYLGVQDPSYVRVDPGRIAAGAITGVGFLGAGVIVKMGATVQGLTTAACLWIVSAIGLSIGTGMYLPGLMAFLLTFFTLVVLRAVEKKTTKLIFKNLTVITETGFDEARVLEVLAKYDASIYNTDLDKDAELKETHFRYTLSGRDMDTIKKILDSLSLLEGVKKLSLRS